MKKIPLTKGKFALVDDLDYEWINQFKWHYSTQGYAERNNLAGEKPTQISMHRSINSTPKGLDTDHINRNKLDNRRENLRTLTRRQNQMNTGLDRNNTSGYKGVYWDKSRGVWLARIKVNGRDIHLGSYKNIQGAWLARKWGERLYVPLDSTARAVT